MDTLKNGGEILLIDKPKGVTSFDVIRVLKKKFNDPKIKMGHAGTLDPNATGLLIVAVGNATKKIKEFVGLPKTYEAEILLGTRTETGDIEGVVLETRDVPEQDEAVVKETLTGMEGVLRLPVSKFSATKQGGGPLYKKAHRGEEVRVLPLRDMEIHRAVFKSIKCKMGQCIIDATFEVASGVYIRSLAEELGKRLGYPATLKNLRRTHVGKYSVEDAMKIK